MLTVACVLSDPIREGHRAYDRSHVERLRGTVADNLKTPHEFVCVDDSPFPGWWAKCSLFEPGRFEGRVLYLDLDVTVVGDLGPIAWYGQPLGIIKDWNRMGFNSSVMAWDAGALDDIYNNFTPEVMDRLQGDQDWIFEEAWPLARRFPRDWCVSYKRAVAENRWPEDMRVCVFHGRPKPWEIETMPWEAKVA